MRIAGAPISWGVCEVPGWGHQLTSGRVLAEMAAAGLTATEIGPPGFLPDEPAAQAALLAAHGLTPVGGFVPLVLHDPDTDPLPAAERAAARLTAAGADVLVLAAATGQDGYDSRPVLDDAQWKALLGHLDRIGELAPVWGVTATLHPHVGTVVERPDEVRRVLAGCALPLCLDTGHLLIGGTDPVELAAKAPDRIAHVHLKDVDEAWAARVRTGEAGYTEAVAGGLYRPLGQGDVDVAGIVRGLNERGYSGWYVLEQDTVLTGRHADAAADVRASLAFLRGLG